MTNGESNGHVTDDVTLSRKVKLVTSICIEHNISKTAGAVTYVAGSRPTKVVCITVLTGNRMGVNCPLWPAATPSEL